LVVGDGGSHFGGGFSYPRQGLNGAWQTPPHFGGGFSRVTAHSFSSPPWWGCVDLRLTHAPHPRGSLSAIARASLLAPPLWGWVKRIPSAPQRGGFSCYRSCPPSWESVPTKISPFRWESVALAQLASPTSVGVFPIDPACPTLWESIARIGQPHQRGGVSPSPHDPRQCGSLSVLLKYTCVTFFQKKFYPQLFKPAHRKGLAPYL
jgi:hypothetical protein